MMLLVDNLRWDAKCLADEMKEGVRYFVDERKRAVKSECSVQKASEVQRVSKMPQKVRYPSGSVLWVFLGRFPLHLYPSSSRA